MNKIILILIILVSIGVRIHLLNHQFISDDFRSLAETEMVTPRELFFRPIQTLIFKGCRIAFGLEPIYWNIMNLVFHIINVYLLMVFVALFTKKEEIALIAGSIFALHFIHIEPIFWTATIGTLIVTLFLLLILLSFLKNRNHLISSIFLIVALLTKETAVVIPLILLVIAYYQEFNINKLIPYFIITFIYIIIRITTGSPFYHPAHYQFQLSSVVFLKNLTFLFSGLTLWVDYRLLHDIWYQSEGLIILINQIFEHKLIFFSLAVSWLFFILSALFGKKEERIAILLILVAFIPFLFLIGSGERFLYIPSIGFVLLLALLINRFSPITKIVVTLVVLFYLYTFSIGSGKKWLIASKQTDEIIKFLTKIQVNQEPGSRIIIINPPQDVEGAWVFKNGLEYIDDLYFPERGIEVVPIEGITDNYNLNDKVIIWESNID